MTSLVERAPAKVNLSLHVLSRRADGYHELESLSAFSASGDLLTLAPGQRLDVSITGPGAIDIGAIADNTILRAATELSRFVPDLRTGQFGLRKKLPVAAGIGGGSSNAAAALRLLARENSIPLDDELLMQAAAEVGSDVPVCLLSRARMMGGRGEVLGEPVRLPPLFAVLINPGVALQTPAVFGQLGLERGEDYSTRQSARSPLSAHPEIRQQMSFDALIGVLRKTRNDLEAPASVLCPAISDVLAVLGAARGCKLARMSGSGATCFGLFETRLRATRAARAIKKSKPDWWVKPCILR